MFPVKEQTEKENQVNLQLDPSKPGRVMLSLLANCRWQVSHSPTPHQLLIQMKYIAYLGQMCSPVGHMQGSVQLLNAAASAAPSSEAASPTGIEPDLLSEGPLCFEEKCV